LPTDSTVISENDGYEEQPGSFLGERRIEDEKGV
jgi:hypothetical protein